MTVQEIQNQDQGEGIERFFISFVRMVLAHMEVLIASGEQILFTYLRYEFNDNGCERGYVTTAEYGLFLVRQLPAILGMEKAMCCAEKAWETGFLDSLHSTILTDNAGNVIPSPAFITLQEQIIREILVFIADLCKQYDTLSPTDKQIIEHFYHFQQLRLAPTTHIDLTFPLVNINSDLQQDVKIGSHIHIAPFTPAEKTAVWNEDPFYLDAIMPKPLHLGNFMNTRFRLAGSYLQSKNDSLSPERNEIFSELMSAITALRLLKEGDVGAPAFFEQKDAISLGPTGLASYPLYDQRVRQYPIPYSLYTLDEADFPLFQEIFDALQKLNVSKASDTQKLYSDLTFALRRFNQSYSRDIQEDQVIDLTIALDSSLFDKKDTELKYKFSLRGAAILAIAGVKDWYPQKSQLFLSIMYDIRSGIVHNGQQLADFEKKGLKKLGQIGILPHEFPKQCENIVREILKAFVLKRARGKSKEDIISELDKWIVDGIAAQAIQ